MQYDEMVAKVAGSLGLSKRLVDKTYKAYWRAIREYITALPLKQDLSEEEFVKIQPNVNIPSIGKLYVTYNRYRYLREDNKKWEQLKENKDVED